MKYLLVLLVVGFGLWSLLTRLRGDAPQRKNRAAPPAASPDAPQQVVECAHCRLHLPMVDALPEGSRLYCSDAHRRLGPVPTPPTPAPPAP